MKTEIKYGLIFGVSLSAYIMLAHVLGFYTTNIQSGKYGDIAVTLLPIVILFLAIREKRRRGGSLTVLQGILTGLLVVLISYPISATFLWIYHHFINPNWLEYIIAYERDKMARAGIEMNLINEQINMLRTRSSGMAQLIGGLFGTLILGFVLSLIISLILRKKPQPSSGGSLFNRLSLSFCELFEGTHLKRAQSEPCEKRAEANQAA